MRETMQSLSGGLVQGASSQGVLFVIGLVGAAAAFIGVVFAANALLSPRAPSSSKGEPYECGMDQAGQPWSAQRLRFATVAMLFVLFDAEAVLLFAVASRLRGTVVALIEVGLFLAFLAAGLVYAWRKGALEWRS
jgi:NADH-quinone oxidoreductase subunit A